MTRAKILAKLDTRRTDYIALALAFVLSVLFYGWSMTSAPAATRSPSDLDSWTMTRYLPDGQQFPVIFQFHSLKIMASSPSAPIEYIDAAVVTDATGFTVIARDFPDPASPLPHTVQARFRTKSGFLTTPERERQAIPCDQYKYVPFK
jgi:hypothetical protein